MSQPQRDITSGLHANMSTLRPRTASEQAYTKIAIETGIAEANNQDDPVLAAALGQLYEESLHYHVRADLLDAVITGNATEQQDKDFATYVKATSKRVGAKGQGERQSSSGGREVEDNS